MFDYNIHFGRRIIYTDVDEITEENVVDVVRMAYAEHLLNFEGIQFLLDFEAGLQPQIRKKQVRTDIDVDCVDNVAHEITEFKTSYLYGCPFTFVQRGRVDTDENKSEEEIKAISILNECYASTNINKKTQEIGRFVEITGIGHEIVLPDSDPDNLSPFYVAALDSRYTFIVRSSRYVDHRKMLGVTYTKNNEGEIFLTVFSDKMRFEMHGVSDTKKHEAWGLDVIGDAPTASGIRNPLGIIPIVEWERSSDRMGAWERCIKEMLNLNLMISDFSNDIENNCQAVWLSVNVDFPKDENGNIIRPSSNEWLMAFTTADGKTPSVHPLTVTYDYEGMLQNINERRLSILEKCNVPQRNDNNGGSTGVAMSDASGWTAADISATKQQSYIEAAKMEEAKIALRICRTSDKLPSDSPLKKLRAYAIQPNIKRQKTYELTVKANAIATLLSHGLYGESVLKNISLFDDPEQVWIDSKEGIEKYQKSIYDKGKSGESYNGEGFYQNRPSGNGAVGGSGEKAPNSTRNSADESDQTKNSPNIDKR